MAHAELKALAEVLGDLESTAPTACADWTVHDIVAHLAAGATEVADLVEEHLAGQPELTRHAASVLNAMPVLDESDRIRQGPVPRRIVLTRPGQPDVVIHAGTAGARLELVEDQDEDQNRDGPANGDIRLATDAANRLLVLGAAGHLSGGSRSRPTASASRPSSPSSGPPPRRGNPPGSQGGVAA